MYTTWSCRVYPSYVKGRTLNLSAKLSESQTDQIADSDAKILERKGRDAETKALALRRCLWSYIHEENRPSLLRLVVTEVLIYMRNQGNW